MNTFGKMYIFLKILNHFISVLFQTDINISLYVIFLVILIQSNQKEKNNIDGPALALITEFWMDTLPSAAVVAI